MLNRKKLSPVLGAVIFFMLVWLLPNYFLLFPADAIIRHPLQVLNALLGNLYVGASLLIFGLVFILPFSFFKRRSKQVVNNTIKKTIPKPHATANQAAMIGFWIPLAVAFIVATILLIYYRSDGQAVFVYVIVPYYGLPAGLIIAALVWAIVYFRSKRVGDKT